MDIYISEIIHRRWLNIFWLQNGSCTINIDELHLSKLLVCASRNFVRPHYASKHKTKVFKIAQMAADYTWQSEKEYTQMIFFLLPVSWHKWHRSFQIFFFSNFCFQDIFKIGE